jgi:hypothetical protein
MPAVCSILRLCSSAVSRAGLCGPVGREGSACRGLIDSSLPANLPEKPRDSCPYSLWTRRGGLCRVALGDILTQ